MTVKSKSYLKNVVTQSRLLKQEMDLILLGTQKKLSIKPTHNNKAAEGGGCFPKGTPLMMTSHFLPLYILFSEFELFCFVMLKTIQDLGFGEGVYIKLICLFVLFFPIQNL